MNKLYVFSDAFYTLEHDTFNHGVVAAANMEEARRLVLTGVDLIEVGETTAYDVLIFAEETREWAPRVRYTNRTISCPGWKVKEGANVSKYEKNILEVMRLPPDMRVVFKNYAKVPETSEYGPPPSRGQWTVTIESAELDGGTPIHFNGFPEFDALLEEAEHTANYTWQETETLPATIEHVLIDVLKYVGRVNEYHDWAGLVRQTLYSETPVDDWEMLTEKIGQHHLTWYRNPDWQNLVPELIRKEASKLTVKFDDHGNPRMVKY